MNKKQVRLLGKAADILDKLAEKCGGPGGKPGPCPLGGAKPEAAKPDAGGGGTSPSGSKKDQKKVELANLLEGGSVTKSHEAVKASLKKIKGVKFKEESSDEKSFHLTSKTASASKVLESLKDDGWKAHSVGGFGGTSFYMRKDNNIISLAGGPSKGVSIRSLHPSTFIHDLTKEIDD